MKHWDDFLSEVMPYVENCPLPVAKNHIKNAAIEFCQRTALWRLEMDRLNIADTIYTYEIATDLELDESISAIEFAMLIEDGTTTPLGITTDDSMNQNYPGWQTVTSDKPSAVMLTDTENLRVYPIPERDIINSLVIGVILKPSRNSAGLPDWIFEQYAEDIAHGAKARLMGMKGRSWYSPEEGIDEQNDFDYGIKNATIRTNKGNSRQSNGVTMRPLA